MIRRPRKRVSYSPIQFRQTVLDNRPYSSFFAMSRPPRFPFHLPVAHACGNRDGYVACTHREPLVGARARAVDPDDGGRAGRVEIDRRRRVRAARERRRAGRGAARASMSGMRRRSRSPISARSSIAARSAVAVAPVARSGADVREAWLRMAAAVVAARREPARAARASRDEADADRLCDTARPARDANSSPGGSRSTASRLNPRRSC